ncbi:MAG: DNA methyltransferase [Dehalococcoidia bacterium]
MTWGEFVAKWKASTLSERAGSQTHFNELCALLGEQTPYDPDFYTFEKGAEKTGGDDGFADVWLRNKFGWEYKGKRKDLKAAYVQLVGYHEALGNPPLLVVCDLDRFEVHTKWTNTESWTYRFSLADLTTESAVEVVNANGVVKDAPRLTAVQVLKALFDDVERLRPNRTTDAITREAAQQFDAIAQEMRKWKTVSDEQIARFISRVVFCMFATDVGLLPKSAFSDIVEQHQTDQMRFGRQLSKLFKAMDAGEDFGSAGIRHFNGELFAGDAGVPPEVTAQEIRVLARVNALNWADVEPSIFGTLFERILRKDTRAKLGAHYTSKDDIEFLVEPVLMAPLRREWEATLEAMRKAIEQADAHGANGETKRKRIRETIAPFLERLASIRVLDPACGSGNFLYVSLSLLKGLEKEALAVAGLHGVAFEPRVHPRQLHGIEINPYAHELASIVIWIGYLQWKHRNALPMDDEDPILEKLDQVRLQDALMNREDPSAEGPVEAEWPEADVIVGNPPFLGGKRLRTELGDEYVNDLFKVWDGRVRREADLCCYFLEKARAQIEGGGLWRAGLLATQGVRGGASRDTLKRIKESGDIFFAADDRKWVLDGAAVHVSMIAFDDGSETRRELARHDKAGGLLGIIPVEGINSDLTTALDLTTARRLPENAGLSFMGDTKIGPFEVEGSKANQMLAAPNPHRRSNADVLRPWINGLDVNGRPRGLWIIDFPQSMSVVEAAKYEAPFEYLQWKVMPDRIRNRREIYARRWWVHGEPRPAMRKALEGLDRFLVTTRHAPHRYFRWCAEGTLPDSALIVFARQDDYFFAVVSSRAHEVWARGTGTQVREAGSGFRYTPNTTFETFPLPWAPGKEPWGDPLVVAIEEAARELDALRNGSLNPPEGSLGESELRKRTLTNLYNERPTWLSNAHRALDAAVFAAYGWEGELSDEEILSRLLALNLERANAAE